MLSFPSNKICPCCGTGGYVWYLKNSEYVAKCTNCGHYFREEDFPMCVIDSDPKPKTNADRIRAMSDEELADFLDRWGMGDIDYSKTFCDLCAGQYDCHDDCLLDWLKQEVE